MSKEILAWAIYEKNGARKGNFVKLDYVPFWFPTETATFRTKNDALRFIRNNKKEGIYEVTRIKIIIEKVTDDECNNT